MSSPKPILGMIAGNGILPVIIANSAKKSGFRVCCVGLRDQYVPELPGVCDEFSIAGIAKVGRWIRLLKRWGAEDTVMVGDYILDTQAGRRAGCTTVLIDANHRFGHQSCTDYHVHSIVELGRPAQRIRSATSNES